MCYNGSIKDKRGREMNAIICFTLGFIVGILINLFQEMKYKEK